jgi:hypothetical protein
MNDEGPPYLLWSNKHQKWWKPGGFGYTTSREEAGRFDREGAVHFVVQSADHGKVDSVTCMVRDYGP